MSTRSTLWKNKKATLAKREVALKEELEEISGEVESRVKKVLTVSLIAGATVLVGYGLYRAFSGKDKSGQQTPKKSEKPSEKPQESPSPLAGFSLKNALLERLALAAIKFIGTQLATYLAGRVSGGEDGKAHSEN